MSSTPVPKADVVVDEIEIMLAMILEVPSMHLRALGELPDVLWHYTDTAGALGILRGRALWATHAFFMNDASELRLAYPLLQDAIDAAKERFAGDTPMQDLATALGAVLSEEGRDPDVYALCFCQDGDLLSQWRAYGRAGGGYALGLDGPALRDVKKTFGLHLVEVIYDPARQREMAKDMVEQTFAVYGRYVTATLTGGEGTPLDAVVRRFASIAATYAYQIKAEAFSEENEWRLICARGAGIDEERADRSFRAGERGLLPYVAIPTESSDDPASERFGLRGLPLREVRVGPTAHPEITEMAMRYLLGDLGLGEVEVHPSTIPLRA